MRMIFGKGEVAGASALDGAAWFEVCSVARLFAT